MNASKVETKPTKHCQFYAPIICIAASLFYLACLVSCCLAWPRLDCIARHPHQQPGCDDGGKTQVRQPSLSTHVLSLVFWLLPPFTLSRHHLFFVFVFTSSPHPCIVTSAFFFLSPSTFNIAIIPLIIVTILSCLSKHLLCYEASWSNSFLGHLSQVSQVLTCNLVVECFCKLEHIGFYSTHCNNCGKKFQTRGSTDLHLHWRCLRQRQPLH